MLRQSHLGFLYSTAALVVVTVPEASDVVFGRPLLPSRIEESIPEILLVVHMGPTVAPCDTFVEDLLHNGLLPSASDVVETRVPFVGFLMPDFGLEILNLLVSRLYLAAIDVLILP